MKNALRSPVYLTLSVLCFGLTLPLAADVIFNNSTNDLLLRFNPGTSQVGNEIILSGSDRFLTDFSFEYWGLSSNPNSFAGTVQAEVEFYQNNGAPFNGYATPGTMFYSSPWFSVPAPTSRNTFVFTAGAGLDFPVGGLLMPVVSNMTWTVQFRGMGVGDSVGVDLYGPPTVGQAYGDYWENDGAGWTLNTNSLAPSYANFAAYMAATVPEPSTLVLSVLGGLGLLIVARRLSRRE